MRAPIIALSLLCLSGPAVALDVDFSGTIASTCSLAISTPGTLALSNNGAAMGSEEGIAIPAVVTVLSIGSNTVTVDAPIWVTSPGSYNSSGESLEVSYFGASGLSLINQAYTASQTSFAASNIPLSALTVNNRISNTNGFVAGTYTTRTVVTCN